jgi:hypothetical protein
MPQNSSTTPVLPISRQMARRMHSFGVIKGHWATGQRAASSSDSAKIQKNACVASATR